MKSHAMNALSSPTSLTRRLNRSNQSFRIQSLPSFTMKDRQEPDRREKGSARSKKEDTLRRGLSMIGVSVVVGNLLAEVTMKVFTPNQFKVRLQPSFSLTNRNSLTRRQHNNHRWAGKNTFLSLIMGLTVSQNDLQALSRRKFRAKIWESLYFL